MMKADALSPLPLAQRDRLKHIDLRLRFLGEVRRPGLMQRFGIQSAAASRDLALYKELAPENVEYESRGKRYLLGGKFSPLFSVPSAQVLGWLAEQLGDATSPTSDSLLPCLMPPKIFNPELDTLACVTRAIHNDLPFYICEFRANEVFQMQRMQRQLISALANLAVPCLGRRGVRVLDINLYDLCIELLQTREGSAVLPW